MIVYNILNVYLIIDFNSYTKFVSQNNKSILLFNSSI